MKKVYLVVITEYEEYRNSHVFETKFEAEKFIRHNILDMEGWAQFIEEKEVIQ